ncbi:MAG TPA: hypothetical protein VHT52_02010 [Stellaceae bacterium]|nr:hypothetical protein [Stellaceae bacterium]
MIALMSVGRRADERKQDKLMHVHAFVVFLSKRDVKIAVARWRELQNLAAIKSSLHAELPRWTGNVSID